MNPPNNKVLQTTEVIQMITKERYLLSAVIDSELLKDGLEPYVRGKAGYKQVTGSLLY